MTPVAPGIPTIRRITSTPNFHLPIPNLGVGSWDLHTGIIDGMLRRQRTGSVICRSCGVLVGVNDDNCYNCGRRNPGLWGFAPLLRSLGTDLGFVPFIIGTCGIVYILTVIASRGALSQGGLLSFLGPNTRALFLFGASGALPVFVAGRWWTVLSAAWLHAGLLHILFNMMAVRQLAPPTADFYGPARTVIIYTAGPIAGLPPRPFPRPFIPPLPLLPGSHPPPARSRPASRPPPRGLY